MHTSLLREKSEAHAEARQADERDKGVTSKNCAHLPIALVRSIIPK